VNVSSSRGIPGGRVTELEAAGAIAMPATAIAYAIEQPGDVEVGEIVIRPTAQA
jgi:NADP-dependent 3-hydroxy acid dehydrogenase YdfG